MRTSKSVQIYRGNGGGTSSVTGPVCCVRPGTRRRAGGEQPARRRLRRQQPLGPPGPSLSVKYTTRGRPFWQTLAADSDFTAKCRRACAARLRRRSATTGLRRRRADRTPDPDGGSVPRGLGIRMEAASPARRFPHARSFKSGRCPLPTGGQTGHGMMTFFEWRVWANILKFYRLRAYGCHSGS